MTDVKASREHLGQIGWAGFTVQGVLPLIIRHEDKVARGVSGWRKTSELISALLLASAPVDHSSCGLTAGFDPSAMRGSDVQLRVGEITAHAI